MSKFKLPDFICCGFQKCATNGLRINLKKHPNITVPDKPELFPDCEFNFFTHPPEFINRPADKKTQADLDWYKSFFPDDGNVHGEFSPNYADWGQYVSKSIHDIHPNVKLLFSLRNPIDRAYSAFNHYRNIYPRSSTWGHEGTAWSPNKSLIWNLKNRHFDVCYSTTLKHYNKYFSLSQMQIVIFEQLKNNPRDTYNKIFNFLGVDHFDIENELIHNRTYDYNLTLEERNECKEYFTDQVDDLFNFLGYKIEQWSDFIT